jgi:hypothetical protein
MYTYPKVKSKAVIPIEASLASPDAPMAEAFVSAAVGVLLRRHKGVEGSRLATERGVCEKERA